METAAQTDGCELLFGVKPRAPVFVGNSRERGARSPRDGSQGFDPPCLWHTFPRRSAKADRFRRGLRGRGGRHGGAQRCASVGRGGHGAGRQVRTAVCRLGLLPARGGRRRGLGAAGVLARRGHDGGRFAEAGNRWRRRALRRDRRLFGRDAGKRATDARNAAERVPSGADGGQRAGRRGARAAQRWARNTAAGRHGGAASGVLPAACVGFTASDGRSSVLARGARGRAETLNRAARKAGRQSLSL